VAILEGVMRPGVNWAFHAQAFLRGSYPILRCHLMIPDNPRNPYATEVPLDVREGNVQEFCKAIFADEHVDMVVKHESRADGHYLCAYQMPNAARILKQEAGEVVTKLRPTATKADFNASVQLMEQVFAHSLDGLERANIIPMIFAGKPKNEFVTQ
jgi:hypothetical protein